MIDYVSTLGPTIVALFTAMIVIIGWFINSSKARKNEIEKEARQYRIEMCLSIIKFHGYFKELTSDGGQIVSEDEKLIDMFEDMMSKVLLYGGTTENVLIEKLSTSFKIAAKNSGLKNVDEATAHYDISNTESELFGVAVRRFRKELRLEKISERKLKKEVK